MLEGCFVFGLLLIYAPLRLFVLRDGKHVFALMQCWNVLQLAFTQRYIYRSRTKRLLQLLASFISSQNP